MTIFQLVGEREGRKVLEIRSPVNLEVQGELVCANAADVQQAVATARRAQQGWAALGVAGRVAYMQKALAVVLADSDEIQRVIISETGKVPTEALMEVWAICDSLAYYSKNARKFLAPERRKVHGFMGFLKKLHLVYQPLGVVGVISPWNAPLVLSMNPAIQALIAGNCVIIKGSEVTPESAGLVGMIFRKAGLPEGVLQVLKGDGQTGAALVEGGINKVAFTGSVATGRKVAEACGRQLIPCTLELGGKDAMIVCADANLTRAATGALNGSLFNSGQYCCGTERIYVVEAIYDQFIQRLMEQAGKLKQGQAHGDEEEVGAIYWDRQLTIIENHVADAVAKGAKILQGGKRNASLKGLYYEPTVMVNVNHTMKIMTEETFGPILCIQKVKDEAEALLLANQSEYGLSGNIWSTNNEKAVRLAEAMATGSVSINDMACTYGIPEAPFGGLKTSGVGQVNGREGLRSYCHAKPIIVDRQGSKDKLQAGYPYTKKNLDGMKKLMRLIWGTRLGAWLS